MPAFMDFVNAVCMRVSEGRYAEALAHFKAGKRQFTTEQIRATPALVGATLEALIECGHIDAGFAFEQIYIAPPGPGSDTSVLAELRRLIETKLELLSDETSLTSSPEADALVERLDALDLLLAEIEQASGGHPPRGNTPQPKCTHNPYQGDGSAPTHGDGTKPGEIPNRTTGPMDNPPPSLGMNFTPPVPPSHPTEQEVPTAMRGLQQAKIVAIDSNLCGRLEWQGREVAFEIPGHPPYASKLRPGAGVRLIWVYEGERLVPHILGLGI